VLQPKPDKIGIGALKWGLVPDWADKPDVGYKMINARTESVFEKPSFKKSIQFRRCLIPANGFYEWKNLDTKNKQCYYIFHKTEPLFCFAGLYSVWKSANSQSWLWTFSILTKASKGVMHELHERMPVLLEKKQFASWLNPNRQLQDSTTEFFESSLSDGLTFVKVTNEVGKISANYSGLLTPIP
jgi:putative SOS response-associated peptidase YedK